MEKQNEHYRKYDIIKTLIIVAGSTAIGYLFEKLGFISANIITVYLLGMLIISVFTRGWLCNLIGAISSVLAFNYFFTIEALDAGADSYIYHAKCMGKYVGK